MNTLPKHGVEVVYSTARANKDIDGHKDDDFDDNKDAFNGIDYENDDDDSENDEKDDETDETDESDDMKKML